MTIAHYNLHVFSVRLDEQPREDLSQIIEWLHANTIPYDLYYHEDFGVEALIHIADETQFVLFKLRWC